MSVGRALATALLLAAGAAGPVEAREWPAPRSHLSDFAGIVESACADSIEALARDLEEKTGAQLAVVTVRDLGGEAIDPVAEELFRAWGIGRRGQDDGVLILLALQERRVRIETGYGLEGILPDGKTGGIIRRVMGPDLMADRFGTGLLRGAEAIALVIAEDRGVKLGRPDLATAPREPVQASRPGPLGVLLLFIFMVIFVGSIVAHQRRRRGQIWGDWRTRRRGGWYDPWGGFGGGLGGMGGFGGFGGGGGGGGGGFGGFGGGRSGGGGASGGF